MKFITVNKKNLVKFIENIKDEDKKELFSFFQNNFKQEFIKLALKNKNAYFLADDENNPVAIGGVRFFRYFNGKKVGQIWLLSTKNVCKHRIFLYKYIKSRIEIFKKEYDILFNYIYKSNFKALLWLKKVGFKEEDIGFNDYKIFYFMKGEK